MAEKWNCSLQLQDYVRNCWNKPICMFSECLTFRMEVRICVPLGEKLCLFFYKKQNLCIPSILIKIRFEQGRPLENLGYRYVERNQEKAARQVTYMLLPLIGNISGNRWDMINLVCYIVLFTFYYISSFHMAWIELWLYCPNKLIKLPAQTENRKSPLADLCTLDIPYLC